MGGRESQGISMEGQTVLTMLMESQILHSPAGSVAILAGGLRKDTVAVAAFLFGRKQSPNWSSEGVE